MIRRLFSIQWYEEQGMNTTPSSVWKYFWCCLFGHNMEPYNYDVAEPCKRCGIEDDRNCMTSWLDRIKTLIDNRIKGLWD
jgi:hypothetical protein